MRFDAITKALDPTFQPQLYKTAGRVDDAEVTGLAASADGKTLYAAGGFKTVASSSGATGVIRKGVAAFDIDKVPGAVRTAFNAKVCVGGGACTVNAVKGRARRANVPKCGSAETSRPSTGSPRRRWPASIRLAGVLTSAVQVPMPGQPIATTATKVTKISVDPVSTRAILLGNFNSISGQTHEEVAVVNTSTPLPG